MYRGRYAPGRRRRKMKRSGILFASVVLILALSIGTTVAYLLDHTESVTNTFTPAKVEVKVEETFTDNRIKENIGAKNTGDIPVYIRITLVEYWKKGEDIVAKPEGASVTKTGLNSTNWIEKDGIYYYKTPLAPKASTEDLIKTVTADFPSGYTYHMDVYTEAVQAEPTSAVIDAWKVVLDGTSITAVN